MKKNTLFICLSLLLFLVFSGCTAALPTTASPQPTVVPKPLPSTFVKEPVSTAPTFDIEGLHNGDAIDKDKLNLQVILHNFTLLDHNTEHTSAANQGHIHYWLDTNPTDPGAAVQVDKDPEHILLSSLYAGQHILTVKLVGTDHQPITETTTQIITFMVKRLNVAHISSATPKPKETPAPTETSITPEVSNTPQSTAKSTENEADAKSATLAIVGIHNGDVISTEDLKFAIYLKNLHLVNYNEHTEAKAGEGHVHIWLDTTSTEPKAAMKVYNDPKHIVIKHIAEGEHTIIVGLVSNDHQTIIGARQAITFSVKR
ncbi:MAG: hypothetical protein WD469_11160 [Paenibacillaceae bacterium]